MNLGGALPVDITKDIQPMTAFSNHSAKFMRHLRETKRPVILTVNGKAAAVVQDAEAYQHLLDLAAAASAAEGIRQGLEDLANGRTRPAREVFDEIRAEHDIPRCTDGARKPEPQAHLPRYQCRRFRAGARLVRRAGSGGFEPGRTPGQKSNGAGGQQPPPSAVRPQGACVPGHLRDR